jgi:hypothetical protein
LILKHFDVLDEDGNGVLDLEDIAKLKKHDRRASKIFDRKYTTSMVERAKSIITSSSNELPQMAQIFEDAPQVAVDFASIVQITHVTNNGVAKTSQSDTLASIENTENTSQPGYQSEENEGDSLAPAHEDSTSATECSSSKPRANGLDYLDAYEIDGSQTAVGPRISGMDFVFSSQV